MRIFKSSVERADDHFSQGRFEKAAELYFKAKRYEQAAEIFRRQLHDIDRAVDAYEKAGKPLEAGRTLEAAERYRDAVAKYQAAGAYRRAAEACLKGSQTLRAASFFEQAEMFERSADCYLDGGEVEGALRVLEKEADALDKRPQQRADPRLDQRLRLLHLRRSDLLQRIGRHREAARLLLDHGQAAKAAPLFEKAGDVAAAVEAYLAARLEDEALRLAEAHPKDVSPEKHAEALLNASRHVEAASIFEQAEKFDAAAMAYEAAGDLPHAAALWEKSGAHQRAAELFAKADRFYDAARCFATSGDHIQAAQNFARAGAARNAGDAYLNADRPVEAAQAYVEAGEAASAMAAIEDIEPEHPSFAEASLILVPLLLDQGQLEEAGKRYLSIMEGLREGRFLERSFEIYYCKARYLEAQGRFQSAESFYLKVMAESIDYRDTAQRLEDIRDRLTADPSLAAPLEELTGVTRTLEAEAHHTQRIQFKPSSASTGTQRPPEPPPATQGMPAKPVSGSSSVVDLPVKIQGRLDAWWDGADFLSVVDRETDEPGIMVAFPLAVIGARASIFEQITRQLRTLRDQTILQLQGTETASDKVLLFYESFGGETLEKALSQGRTFSPRDSLRLVVQLCEALTRAHKLGLTHQWLSPRTVLVDEDNRCKMVGLGLREFLVGENPTSRFYLSPEVKEGLVVGPTSDVYSLGRLAMTLLDATTPSDLNRRKRLEPTDVSWPSEVEKEIPSSLRHFLVRCLESDPLARPSTAEMAAALAAIGFLPGQLLDDRYEIVREIGRGGMSRVYRATDRELGGDLAIKTVLTPALGRTEDEERLFREVQISRRITHSNVVRVHDLGRFPGGIFVIMELLEGPGLDEVIRDEHKLEPTRVKRLILEIASALGEAHRLHIVHRDLKPGNVILVDGRAKVLDFGIARARDDSTHLTRTGEVVGSPLYMAPEQIQGQEVDGRCDLYALGVMAYTMLTGREPFAADSPTSVVLKHLNDPPPDIRQDLPEIDGAWVDLLGKLLAKQPEDRFEDAEALLEAAAALPA